MQQITERAESLYSKYERIYCQENIALMASFYSVLEMRVLKHCFKWVQGFCLCMVLLSS